MTDRAPGRPRIGVSCGFDDDKGKYLLPRGYCDGVLAAGGLPAILPYTAAGLAAETLDGLDGLLLTGGPDLDPAHFGEPPHPRLGRVVPDRDAHELALCREALARGMPVLGICRGIQVLAVAAGGTLWQDVPSQVAGAIQHYQDAPRWHGSHRVEVQPNSLLAALIGTAPPPVNSFHHQAVRDVPPGFAVTARAPDGVVEAVEHPGLPFCLGVQWHPEDMWQDVGAYLNLFRGLVEAAAGRRAGAAHATPEQDRPEGRRGIRQRRVRAAGG